MTPPLEALGMIALRRLDPEAAHGLALKALQMGLGPKGGPFTSPRLATTLAGLSLPNPVGLAAGFDKNATALAPLARCGFGFVEVGAATPRPQPGNPRPRLFRLTEDRAAINRFGFNNDGMQAIAARLADGIVVTSDNPRSEPPGAIIAAILAGIPAGHDGLAAAFQLGLEQVTRRFVELALHQRGHQVNDGDLHAA